MPTTRQQRKTKCSKITFKPTRLIQQTRDLLNKNPAPLNTLFLDNLSYGELNVLHHRLKLLDRQGKLSLLDRASLYQIIGLDKTCYFYSDALQNSMIFDGALSPLKKDVTLGKGKFGQAYLFRSAHKKKVVKYNIAQDSHFENEASIANKAGLSAILFFKPADERLVTNYQEGRCLIHLLKSKNLTLQQWLELSLNFARAILQIHAKGIVHNDITAFNVLVDDKLQVNLIDYGESLEEPTLCYVDTYAFCQILYTKFRKMNPQKEKDTLSELLHFLDKSLDNPQSTSLEDIISFFLEVQCQLQDKLVVAR